MKLLMLVLFAAVAVATPIPMDDAVEVVVNGLAKGEALDIGHIVDVKVKDIVDGEVAAVANALHPFTAQGLAEIAQAEAVAAAPAPEVIVPEAATPEYVPQPIVLPEAAIPEYVPQPIVLPEAAIPEYAPQPIVLPEAAIPEYVPQPIVLPEAAIPEYVPQPIVLPEAAIPEYVPQPIVLPETAIPEYVPQPIVLPEAAIPEYVPQPIVLPEVAIPEYIPEPIVLPESVAPEVAPGIIETPEAAEVPAPQHNGEIFNDGTVSITVNTSEDAGVIATLSSWVSMMVNYVNSGIAYTQQLI